MTDDDEVVDGSMDQEVLDEIVAETLDEAFQRIVHTESLDLLKRTLDEHPHLATLLAFQRLHTLAPTLGDVYSRRGALLSAAKLDELAFYDPLYDAKRKKPDQRAGVSWDPVRGEITARKWPRPDGGWTPTIHARPKRRGLYREMLRALYLEVLQDTPEIAHLAATRLLGPALGPFFPAEWTRPYRKNDHGHLYKLLTQTIRRDELKGS